MPSYAYVVGVPALSAIPDFLEFMLFIKGPAVVNIHSVPGVFPLLLVSLLMLACLAFMLWLAFLLLLGSCCC
jgi:hypothetical protein